MDDSTRPPFTAEHYRRLVTQHARPLNRRELGVEYVETGEYPLYTEPTFRAGRVPTLREIATDRAQSIIRMHDAAERNRRWEPEYVSPELSRQHDIWESRFWDPDDRMQRWEVGGMSANDYDAPEQRKRKLSHDRDGVA
jgi:hypothetical protein